MATASSQAPHKPARTAREDTGPVAVKGTLIVKWIAGRNGDFAVGDLRTPIGEFRVKDALLDQFDEGEYQGIFWISQIYAKSYEYRGRITIETRASIADLQIDLETDAPQESHTASEPDPIDEAPRAPEPAPAEPPLECERTSASTDELGDANADVNAESDADKARFGNDIFEQLQAGRNVKLDPTIDRLLFRQQKERLKALHYAFDVKSQSWYPQD